MHSESFLKIIYASKRLTPWITPLRVLLEPNAVSSFHQMGALCKLELVLRVMRHNTNSRTFIQITSVQHLRYRVSSHTHTRGAREVVALSLGGNLDPYDDIWGQIPRLSFHFFKSEAGYLLLFTPNAFSSHWGIIGRPRELMLQNCEIFMPRFQKNYCRT